MLSASPQDHYEFMKVQVHRIEIDKWCQGERQHSDPGDGFIIDWVYTNAKSFRDEWQNSLCKHCINHRECGYYALCSCDNYIQM